VVVIVTIVLAIIIPFYYKHMDKKALASGKEEPVEKKDVENPDCPWYYALFPALPLVILIVWAFVPKASPDVVAANFIGIIFVALVELLRHPKESKKVASQMKVVFKAMGESFTNVVSIIIAASIFAAAINKMGGITIIADAISHLQGASILTMILMGLITFMAAVIMGSGSASWFALAPLVPSIASKLSVNSLSIMLPMELGSSIGRSLSPVAGCTIAIAGYADIDVFEMIKLSAPLLIIEFIVTLLVTMFMFIF
jgi:DcuC family C4-dicarboxylate transporter